MAPTAIICLGNRWVAGDALGCRVYDQLAGTLLPADIALIDGGLCGIDLLHLMSGRRRVICVDAVTGLAAVDEIVVLDRHAVAAYATGYGHGAGLPYLLHLLPAVCPPPLPVVTLVGAECQINSAAAEPTVRAVAARCLELAVDDKRLS